jgi:CubicO group peptidase (beta-lactamase class C family)
METEWGITDSVSYRASLDHSRGISQFVQAWGNMRTAIVHRLNLGDNLLPLTITAVVLTMLCLPSLCCGPLSSRIIYDPKPSVERLNQGRTTIEAEVNELAMPLLMSKEATCLEIGVLLPDGSVRSYGYGRTRDAGPPTLPDKNTVFQIGSVSKLFTASVLALLVQEGRIHYSDTVRDILPKSVKLSPDVGKMTLYELATHTSGLPREPVTLKQFLFFIDYQFTGRNLYGYINKNWLYNYLGTFKVKNKSHKFIYSNIGYGLLAHLLEVKTGETFQNLVAEDLLLRLDMRDTVFSLSQDQHERQAEGHAGDQPFFMKRNAPMPSWDMGEIMTPSGGIYSTTNDLLIYVKHTLLIRNSILDSILLKTTEPVIDQRDGERSSLGWTISEVGDDHTQITYKHGMASGYNAYIGMDVSKKIAVIVLCSSFNWNDKIGHNLLLRLSHASDLSKDRLVSEQMRRTAPERVSAK